MGRWAWTVGLLAALGAGPAAADVVLLSDNLDTETLALNYAGFADWNVLNATMDVIGPGFFDLQAGHGRYVDMDGSSGDAGRLESKTLFSLDPGDYRLDFLLAGSQRGDTNSLTASLGSFFSETFTRTSAEPFAPLSRTFNIAAGSTARLAFDHTGGDNLGLLLDDVTLTRLDPVGATPEPGSLALMGAGLVGVVLRRRRHRAGATTGV